MLVLRTLAVDQTTARGLPKFTRVGHSHPRVGHSHARWMQFSGRSVGRRPTNAHIADSDTVETLNAELVVVGLSLIDNGHVTHTSWANIGNGQLPARLIACV